MRVVRVCVCVCLCVGVWCVCVVGFRWIDFSDFAVDSTCWLALGFNDCLNFEKLPSDDPTLERDGADNV